MRDYENEILQYLREHPKEGATLSQCKDELKIPSKDTVHNHLNRLVKKGKIKLYKTEGKKKIYRIVSFGRRFLDMMEGYPTVAVAPFCPVITGAHAVLRGGTALVIPLNKYVCVGLKKEKPKGNGGRVTIELEESTKRRMEWSGFAMQQLYEVERYDTVNAICDVAEIAKPRCDFSARLYSDINISSGCGGSGAVAVSTVLALLASLGEIEKLGPLSNGLEGYRKAVNSAYRLEQLLHGRSRLKEEYSSPFSSGASPLCAFHTSEKSRSLAYRLTNADRVKHNPDEYPKENIEVVTENLLPPLLLVAGDPKRTQECLRNVELLHERLGGEIDSSFFAFWKHVSKEIINSFRVIEREFKDLKVRTRLITKAGELLKIQNGLYSSLGLDNTFFTDLIKATVENCTGGSIIGGGGGGSCVLIYDDYLQNRIQARIRENVKSKISGYPQILDESTFERFNPAQILRV